MGLIGRLLGLDGLRESMRDHRDRQLPFIAARTLTVTAKQVAAAETRHITEVFDNPTPFTKRAIGFTPATKYNLVATIFVKDIQAHYLMPQVEGGKREFKTFEDRFAESGQVSQAMVALPGDAAKRNTYGNISKAQIIKIAKDLNSSGSAKRFFAGKPKGSGDRPEGIWTRVNNNTGIAPLMVFATDATYEKRFQFSEIANETVNETFEKNLLDSWQLAMRTAK